MERDVLACHLLSFLYALLWGISVYMSFARGSTKYWQFLCATLMQHGQHVIRDKLPNWVCRMDKCLWRMGEQQITIPSRGHIAHLKYPTNICCSTLSSCSISLLCHNAGHLCKQRERERKWEWERTYSTISYVLALCKQWAATTIGNYRVLVKEPSAANSLISLVSYFLYHLLENTVNMYLFFCNLIV